MTMERKIGEIFEYNGEWYQCIEQPEKYDETVCSLCAFQGNGNCELDKCSGTYRADKKSVIFKKLEKVGEPIIYMSRTFQGLKSPDTKRCEYCYFRNQVCNPELCGGESFLVEIKQNKEDMKEKKLNLKPFDIQKAREGKPVCTRDGAKARIICFDAKSDAPIIALITADDGTEITFDYLSDGTFFNSENPDNDLMMLPEKKEGWVNVYRDCDGANITKDDNIYSSKDAAIASAQIIDRDNYVATTIIRWEE